MAEIGKDIKKAKQLLGAGELVAIPTETVYGLAGNALSDGSVLKIFEVKNRPHFDPLIVHVPSLDAVARYVEDVPEGATALARRFWPGPLTLLLKKKHIIPDLVTSGLDTVGIRCPDHFLTRSLLETLEFPLAAPSANPFGYISPTTPAHVQDQLGQRIPYILDGGPCAIGIESTIVTFDNADPVVLRMGGLSVEAIEEVIGKVRVRTASSSNPRAPGQLHTHYAPRKKLLAGDVHALLEEHSSETTAVLSFRENLDVPYQYVLSPSGDLAEAARNFFSALRALDRSPARLIVAEFVPDTGLGKAINDRLRRASAGSGAGDIS